MGDPTGDRMIRVDMTNQTASIEPYPEDWKLLGGRSLSARILLTECDPTCDPLGLDNILVIAPGLLAGTSAPTSGRLSVGGKSPLTGGIKEANVGGDPGQDLMKLGYRCVIVKGQPADPERRYAIDITGDDVKVIPADEHKGKWNYKLIEDLAKTYSPKASFISIGPAGEMKLSGASVACTDHDKARRPARHAARGGLGAVMGSKGIKYMSVDATKRPTRKPENAKEFYALSKKYTKEYQAGPGQEPFPKWGTSAIVTEANNLYTFPHKNRVEGRSPDVETLDGMRIVESFAERGGGMHNCMTGCIVKCSNIVHDKDGNYKTSALEFETLTLLGSNCGIASWEDVADLDRSLRGKPQKGGGVPERGIGKRNHLHPWRHRGHQPGRRELGRGQPEPRRRGYPVAHGAPFQHRAVADPAPAKGHRAKDRAHRRRRQFPFRRIPKDAFGKDQNGRRDPRVQCLGHHRAGRGGHPPGP